MMDVCKSQFRELFVTGQFGIECNVDPVFLQHVEEFDLTGYPNDAWKSRRVALQYLPSLHDSDLEGLQAFPACYRIVTF